MRFLGITAACLGFLAASGFGAPAHAQTVQGVGATSQPMVYVNVGGIGGHLRQLVWNGVTWYWYTAQTLDLVVSPVGVVHHGPGDKPWAFVVRGDGNVYGVGGMGGTGSVWSADARGKPSGVNVELPLGACSGDSGGNRAFTFIRASDGNVWSNDGVTGWLNHGTPSGVSIVNRVGATTVSGTRPYLFVVGSDGNLWLRWWTGSAWQWQNHGNPGGSGITGSVGVTTISGNRPFAFITASDGNLWSRSWSGSSWGWQNHGTPAGAAISGRVGVANAGHDGRPYAFVTGTDGHLWSQGWSGSSWIWENHGIPGGIATITTPIAAVGVDGDRPYAFVMASDGNLWQRWWTGSAWGWYNHGAPPY
jgi:hypothetical protein